MALSSPSQRLVQKLTVALIFFVNLTLVLAVTIYLFFRKADERFQLLEARQRELDEEKSKRLEAVNQQRALVRDVLGLPEDLDNAEILRRRKTAAEDASGR